MWKLAQRNLLQGKAYRSTPRQYTFERTCYLATKSNTSSSTQRDAENGSPRSYKRQHRQVSKPMSNVEDAKRFFESTKGFLGQSSTTESSWTREHLGVANKILHTWSRQTIPRELQPSWIEMADQLISTALDQYQLIETFNQQSSTNLIPDSTVFCNIITTYSKSNLPHSAERADYWLQKMIQTSYLYPDRVTPPRATLFANVLSAWEKSRHPDAEARALVNLEDRV